MDRDTELSILSVIITMIVLYLSIRKYSIIHVGQMQLQVPTGAHLFRYGNQAQSKQSEDRKLYLDRLNEVLNSLTLTEQ